MDGFARTALLNARPVNPPVSAYLARKMNKTIISTLRPPSVWNPLLHAKLMSIWLFWSQELHSVVPVRHRVAHASYSISLTSGPCSALTALMDLPCHRTTTVLNPTMNRRLKHALIDSTPLWKKALWSAKTVPTAASYVVTLVIKMKLIALFAPPASLFKLSKAPSRVPLP